VIFRRVLLALIAASAFAAGAAVAVVSLAFALYALVEPTVGAAGAAATVAGVTAALMALGGLLVMFAARPRRKPEPPPADGALERAMAFIRQKPLLSGAAAVGAGLLAVRNPKYLGEVLRSFLEGRPPPK
jgi:hypothetical protein